MILITWKINKFLYMDPNFSTPRCSLFSFQRSVCRFKAKQKFQWEYMFSAFATLHLVSWKNNINNSSSIYLFSILFTKHCNSPCFLCIGQWHDFWLQKCCISNPFIDQAFNFNDLVVFKRSMEVEVKPEAIKSHQWTSLRCFLAYYFLKCRLEQMCSSMMDLEKLVNEWNVSNYWNIQIKLYLQSSSSLISSNPILVHHHNIFQKNVLNKIMWGIMS